MAISNNSGSGDIYCFYPEGRKGMNKRVSLSRITIAVQVTLFTVVLGLALLVGFYFQKNTVEEEAAARGAELTARVRELESRLGRDALQVKEILYEVIDNNGLWSEDKEHKYFDKMAVKKLMSDKSLLHPDLETLFVCRKEDFYLGIVYLQGSGSQRLAYRDYVMEHVAELVSDSNQNLWRIREIDGVTYCFLVYEYPKAGIYVGVGLPENEIFSDLKLLFEVVSGSMTIKDCDDQPYVYYASDEPGEIKLESVSSNAGLTFECNIDVNALEFMRRSTFASVLLIVFVSVGSILVQNLILRRAVIRPVTKLSGQVKNAADEGGRIEQLVIAEDARTEEIYTLQAVLNHLLQEVLSGRIQLYKNQVEKQDGELRQLRSQLRPHFYLNAIMTVSSMTYQNRNEDIREYLARLSGHMRYMMRIMTSTVTLKEELSHIENYVNMQEIKFPSSVILMTECPGELEQARIPHLLLYTVVENAFKYAMTLQETMVLTITCGALATEDFDGYRVVLEDNGKGFDEETRRRYNNGEILEDREEKHIGLSNVKRSLLLQYGRKDLLRLSNALPHGARVEIWIPNEKGYRNGFDSTDR